MRCSSCSHDNRAGRRFCAECGTVLATVCAACGASNEPDEKFCGDCGGRLGPVADAPAAATRHAEPGIPLPVGERRQLTALFCDLVGSTEIASQLDPEDWHRISKEYQQVAAGAVDRYGGHVDKFLGDGLVCFFGVPQAHEDDAERAVRAGLAIVEAVQGLNAQAVQPVARLRVRVALHTGSVVVADGGGEATDVFGDVPNVAARVQETAEPDTVVITAATQRLVAGIFVVEERGAQKLKGVRNPVDLYRVVQPSGVRSRFEATARRLSPFVGRQTELGVLSDAWERVVDGLGQTVLVQGEAGVGKSRLCYQLRALLGGQPHTWLECRCSPFTSGTPFRPVTELVEQVLSFQPTSTPAERLAKLGEGLALSGLATDEALPLLAEWLALPETAGYAPLRISPDLKRRKLLDILAVWNLKLGELQPMVVLVEDLHWCDPSSLELIGRLIVQGATTRILLIATTRPEFANPWPPRSHMQTLVLGRLTKRQTRELIDAMPAANTLPEAVLEQLVARADGIPLFAEELTQGVVAGDSAAAVTTIPVTLQDSLLARLDRLSSAKKVAQRASVLGREFSHRLLAATAGMDEATLQQGLTRLVEAELVFVRGGSSNAIYTFKHALVHEAAYASLLKRTRRQLHARVFDALVVQFPERAAAEPELLARHAEGAGRVDEAITHHQRAGDRAQARSAHEEAIGHLRHAIALLATLPHDAKRDAREVALQLALGGSLQAARGYAHPEVEPPYERARVLCEGGDDTHRHGLALIGLELFHHNRGEGERARELGTRVLTVAERSSDAELALHGHIQLAILDYYAGKHASALVHLEAARALYEPGRDDASASMFAVAAAVTTTVYDAWNLWVLGWPDRALARANEALELARRLDHPFSLANALLFASVLQWLRRDTPAQLAAAAAAIALSEAQGFPLWLAGARMFHSGARVAGGDPGAVADLLAGLELAAQTGNQVGAPALLALLVEAYLTAGQVDNARGAIEMGLAIGAQTGQSFFDSELHRLQGEIALRTVGGQPSAMDPETTAEGCFRRALDIARAHEAKSFELRAAIPLARLWLVLGKRAAARELIAPIRAWFAEGFDTGDLVDAKALLDELA